MKIAFNYQNGMIIKDAKGELHIFCGEEMEIIRTALYKWTQKKEPIIYEYKTSIEE